MHRGLVFDRKVHSTIDYKLMFVFLRITRSSSVSVLFEASLESPTTLSGYIKATKPLKDCLGTGSHKIACQLGFQTPLSFFPTSKDWAWTMSLIK